MRARSWSLCLMLATSALVLAAMSPGTGAAGHETFVVEGKELLDCTPPVLICFDVVSGNPDTDILEGETITVTLRPVGDAPHNINVIEESNSDSLHLDTDASQAIGSSSTASSGLETSFQFKAPAEGTVLYFWCDVVEHEILGMWFTATVGPAPAGTPGGNNTTGGPTTQNGTAPTGNETGEGDNTTVEADNQTADDSARGDNATVAKSDEAVEEDAAGPAWLVAVIAAASVAWRARARRA